MTDQTPVEEAAGYLEARRGHYAMLRQEDTHPIDTIWGKPLTARTVQCLLEQIRLDEQRLTELRRQLDAAEVANPHPDHPDHYAARLEAFVTAWRAKTGADDETPILSAHGDRRQWSHLTLGDLLSLLRERAVLRRRLDAAEAAPCGHDGTAFDALERLHARIHRDLNFDANESAAPDDERWARVMDDLVTFADEVYMPLADATKAPIDQPTPDEEFFSCGESVTAWHTIRIFDGPDLFEPHRIVRQYEELHPAECAALPAGAACWLHHAPMKEQWPTEPGTYRIRIETRITGGYEEPDYDSFIVAESVAADANPLESAVAEARADIAATPAEPLPCGHTRHILINGSCGECTTAPWLLEAGDD